MYILGLTGGIATGKTSVSDFLKTKGAVILDADLIVHELLAPGQLGHKAVLTHFGNDVLNADQTIDRAKLGALVFNDEAQRQKLNELIHPLVRQELKNRVAHYEQLENKANTSSLLVMVIPLLYESNLAHLVDRSWVVYCPEPAQKKRLMARNNYSEEEAMARIHSQISIEEKVKKADEVLDNSRNPEYTQEQVNLLLEGLKWDAYSP